MIPLRPSFRLLKTHAFGESHVSCVLRTALQRSRKMFRHKGLGPCPKLWQARREAVALWAVEPKAQNDSQRGSETINATVRRARMIEQMMRSLHPALCQKPEARTTALQNEFVSPDFARQAVSLRSRAQTFLKHLSEKTG